MPDRFTPIAGYEANGKPIGGVKMSPRAKRLWDYLNSQPGLQWMTCFSTDESVAHSMQYLKSALDKLADQKIQPFFGNPNEIPWTLNLIADIQAIMRRTPGNRTA